MGQFYTFSPVSYSFVLKDPNSNFKFMAGQPNSPQSLKKGQKLTEYNPFMDRCTHTLNINFIPIFNGRGFSIIFTNRAVT